MLVLIVAFGSRFNFRGYWLGRSVLLSFLLLPLDVTSASAWWYAVPHNMVSAFVGRWHSSSAPESILCRKTLWCTVTLEAQNPNVVSPSFVNGRNALDKVMPTWIMDKTQTSVRGMYGIHHLAKAGIAVNCFVPSV